MIYTGPVDAFFDHRFGKLPYRSINFRFETHDVEVIQQIRTAASASTDEVRAA